MEQWYHVPYGRNRHRQELWREPSTLILLVYFCRHIPILLVGIGDKEKVTNQRHILPLQYIAQAYISQIVGGVALAQAEHEQR